MKKLRPPSMAEGLLKALLPTETDQAMFGDFEEGFQQSGHEKGWAAARLWYWRETLLSLPSLLIQLLTQRRQKLPMDKYTFPENQISSAVLGFFFFIPALLLVIPGILFSGFGMIGAFDAVEKALFGSRFLVYETIYHPAIILGGLILGVGLNLYSVVRLKFGFYGGVLESRIALKASPMNIALLLLAGFLVTVILVYVFFENIEFVAYWGGLPT